VGEVAAEGASPARTRQIVARILVEDLKGLVNLTCVNGRLLRAVVISGSTEAEPPGIKP